MCARATLSTSSQCLSWTRALYPALYLGSTHRCVHVRLSPPPLKCQSWTRALSSSLPWLLTGVCTCDSLHLLKPCPGRALSPALYLGYYTGVCTCDSLHLLKPCPGRALSPALYLGYSGVCTCDSLHLLSSASPGRALSPALYLGSTHRCVHVRLSPPPLKCLSWTRALSSSLPWLLTGVCDVRLSPPPQGVCVRLSWTRALSSSLPWLLRCVHVRLSPPPLKCQSWTRALSSSLPWLYSQVCARATLSTSSQALSWTRALSSSLPWLLTGVCTCDSLHLLKPVLDARSLQLSTLATQVLLTVWEPPRTRSTSQIAPRAHQVVTGSETGRATITSSASSQECLQFTFTIGRAPPRSHCRLHSLLQVAPLSSID